jgi:hypothetical protein
MISDTMWGTVIGGDIPSLARPVIDGVRGDALGAAAAQGINEDEEFQLILPTNGIDIRRKHPTCWKVT